MQESLPPYDGELEKTKQLTEEYAALWDDGCDRWPRNDSSSFFLVHERLRTHSRRKGVRVCQLVDVTQMYVSTIIPRNVRAFWFCKATGKPMPSFSNVARLWHGTGLLSELEGPINRVMGVFPDR